MSAKRTIATNTIVQLIGKAVNTTSSLLVTLLIARSLGADFYGEFTKAFVTATLFFIGIDFGLNAIVVRRIVKDQANEQEEFRNTLGLRLLFAVASLALLAVFLLLVPTADDQGYSARVKFATLIFGLTFFEHASFTTANSIFQRRLQYAKSVLASVVGSLVVLGAVAVAVAAKADIRIVALSHVAGSLTMMAIALVFVKDMIGKVSPTFVWRKMMGLFKEALPLGFTLLLSVLTTRIGIIVLSLLKSNAEVGFYGLAYRAFDVALVFPTFFMNATYPIMVEQASQGRDKLKKIVKQSAAVLLVVSLLSTAALYSISPLLAFIREEFGQAQTPLKILSLSLPLFFLTSLLQWTIVTLKKEKVLIPVYAAATGLNLTANLLLIPRYGMLAAAATTVITEAAILFLLAFPVLQSFRRINRETS